MTMTSAATKSQLPADWAPLVEKLRLAHVGHDGAGVDVDDIALGAPRVDAADAIVVDAQNGLVDVDARLSLPLVSRALRSRGWELPLLRPLPAGPLWRLAMRAPFLVDALIQRATLVTGDGDLVETPAAPRHSTGPSLLHAASTLAPLAVLVRARLRIVSATHTTTWRERFDDVTGVAERLRALVDTARAFGACAHGHELVVLGGTSFSPAGSSPPTSAATDSAHPSGRIVELRWTAARSIRPGDVYAMAAALRAGRRVVSFPYLQRTAVLERGRPARVLLDVKSAVAALAAALSSAPANAPRDRR